jgi:hypothetical protein
LPVFKGGGLGACGAGLDAVGVEDCLWGFRLGADLKTVSMYMIVGMDGDDDER